MAYKDEIEQGLKKALKEKDAFRVSVLRMLLSALSYKEIEKRKPLTEEEFYAVVKTMIKQHVESIESFKKGQRHGPCGKGRKRASDPEGVRARPDVRRGGGARSGGRHN